VSEVLELLGPIFLLVALGAVLQRGGFFRPGVVPGLNRLCYWVALPALILSSLTRGGPGAGDGWASWGGRGLMVMGATTLLVAALGWVVACALNLRWEDRGTFAQAFFRGNLAFVGLPILLKAPGVDAAGLMLLLAPMMVLYNVLSVAVLVASRHGLGWATVRPLAGEWLRNPIIWSSAIGGLAYARGWMLAGPVGETVGLVGKMAVPLALLTIGAVLAALPTGAWRGVTWAAVAGKVALSPLLGWGLAVALGIEGSERLVLLVGLACPTALISYTMAEQMGGDEALAAQAVVASTAASAGVLALILAVA
jgi:malate permease and related proteins